MGGKRHGTDAVDRMKSGSKEKDLHLSVCNSTTPLLLNYTNVSHYKMNKQDAKLIAETITAEEIREMLLNAQRQITDWKKPTKLNSHLSLGYAFNLYSKVDYDKPLNRTNKMVIYNAICIFGDYLPEQLKPKSIKKEKRAPIRVFHQDPNFLSDD